MTTSWKRKKFMSDWFWYVPAFQKPVRVQWLDKSPVNKRAWCDRCRRPVGVKEKRLRIDNDRGRSRKRGKGKNHEYICTDCARNVPDPERDQGELF